MAGTQVISDNMNVPGRQILDMNHVVNPTMSWVRFLGL